MTPAKKTGLSLSSRLLLLGALPAVVMFVVLMVFFTVARLDDARENLEKNNQLLADSLAPALEYAVVSGNKRALEQVLRQSLLRSEANWIRVTDLTGTELGFVSHGIDRRAINEGDFRVHTAEILQEPVEFGGDLFAGGWSGNAGALRVGTVEVGVNPNVLESREQEILWSSVIVGGVVLAFTLVIVNHFLRNILSPVHSLARRVANIIEGDYQKHRVPVQGNASELLEIHQQLNDLATHLRELETSREETLRISEEARSKAEHASQAKSEFLTAMSNELRTPLHGVLGTLNQMRDEPLSLQQSESLATVQRSTEDLLTVISDVLDYASMENGSFATDKQEFDLRPLVENCAASFQLAAEQQGASLELQLLGEWSDSVMVMGDAPRVRQILAGLLENTLMYSDSGFVSLRSHLLSLEDQRVTLNCTVTDSGGGAMANQLNSAFGGIEQTPPGDMGLPVVQRLVELMGGYIKVEHEAGHSSSICFELVFDLATEPSG
ncbi:sensor histidine kinase [Marinobacter persicus]|uniref:histidine kinase n=1 Tax=Marinobacter persicus TaxID=930118 RepID=A0A2S6G552_9GAMM|nr:histidine kinase dimerization/phospho-acceptor domain-containing protein [Marinobacter persicus]PPK50778.1 signal transduction histidine kinase [Marinobacter persicus]PPK54230.1 signal transduction histidine kinase [Marinobacter persicus]PPK57366.1 signal transduction histidine kinase [Marinobacter persicus]